MASCLIERINMKRYFALLLLVFATFTATAGDRVSSSEAFNRASAFFSDSSLSGKMKSASGRNSIKLVMSAPDNAFYIYNREGGGFVIISGDDNIGPYLAYSYENTFCCENIPENVRNYLSALEQEVRYFRGNSGLKLTVPITTDTTSYSEKVLPTAKWNQNYPFNKLCPTVGGERCYTGCIATAMAILLRYKRWPDKGTGHLDEYKTSTLGLTVGGYDLGHIYDWDNMPLDVSGGIESYQEEQIATLLRDCAVMLQTDFNTDGSGSHSEYVLPALIKYMKYDAGNILRYRFMYTAEEWMSMIRGSIDNDCPVLFAGETGDGGHEFVVDGYCGDNYVDINFGWGGHYNGIYLMSDMGGFSRAVVAIFNLKKDEGNLPISEDLLLLKGEGISIIGQYKDGTGFKVNLSELHNYGTETFNGDVAIGLNNESGELQKIISEVVNLRPTKFVPRSLFLDFTFSCNATHIKAGRGIQAYFRHDVSSSWEKVAYDKNESTVGIAWPVSPDPDPEDDTDFEYDRTTGLVTITFPKGVDATCRFSEDGCWYFGDDWDTGGANKRMSISTTDLKTGDYTITFSVGGGNERTITLTVDNSKRQQ